MECLWVKKKNNTSQQIGFLFVIYSDRTKQKFICGRGVPEERHFARNLIKLWNKEAMKKRTI